MATPDHSLAVLHALRDDCKNQLRDGYASESRATELRAQVEAVDDAERWRDAARELHAALRTMTDDVDPDKNPPGKTFRRMAAEGNAVLEKHAKAVRRG